MYLLIIPTKKRVLIPRLLVVEMQFPSSSRRVPERDVLRRRDPVERLQPLQPESVVNVGGGEAVAAAVEGELLSVLDQLPESEGETGSWNEFI